MTNLLKIIGLDCSEVSEVKGAKRDNWSHMSKPRLGSSGVNRALTQAGLGLNFSSIMIYICSLNFSQFKVF